MLYIYFLMVSIFIYFICLCIMNISSISLCGSWSLKLLRPLLGRGTRLLLVEVFETYCHVQHVLWILACQINISFTFSVEILWFLVVSYVLFGFQMPYDIIAYKVAVMFKLHNGNHRNPGLDPLCLNKVPNPSFGFPRVFLL